MMNIYWKLLRKKGNLAFSSAGLLARMALPMTGIAIILLLSQLYEGYALAGMVSATFVFTYAIISPQISRWVDYYGQSKVLPLASLLSILGLCLLVISATWRLPIWTLFIAAIFAGCMPSMSAMVRARWSYLYQDQPELQTAYSLETVLDEVSFILGPPLSVGLAFIFMPQVGVLFASILLGIGVLFFVLQKETEPQIEHHEKGVTAQSAVILFTDLQLLVALMIVMGIIVGAIDISSVAFSASMGKPWATSFILVAYALGSCLSGLVFGTLTIQRTMHEIFIFVGLATALTTLLLLSVVNVFTFALSVFVAGIFFAPTMIIAMSFVEKIVPVNKLTEGLTWLLAGLNIGVALGAGISGQLTDLYGYKGSFWLAFIAGLCIILIVLFSSKYLKKYSH